MLFKISLRYLLAVNPEIQAELYEKISKEMSTGVTYEGLKKVKFIDACIKESMRLYTTGSG